MRILAGLLLLVSSQVAGCVLGGSRPLPAAVPGAKYTLVRGEILFFDSGCSQSRKADGKLTEGAAFYLVADDEDGCWLVTLMDEVDTYIQPNGNLVRSKRSPR